MARRPATPRNRTDAMPVDVRLMNATAALFALLGAVAVATVAVLWMAKQPVFALRDRCPHKGGPLSQGIVFGDKVACPLHNWTIALDSGRAVTPDEGCVRRFAVRVEAGRVLLDAVTPLADAPANATVTA